MGAHKGKSKTFKLVGDNIDKNIKPHDMRLDSQTKSLILRNGPYIGGHLVILFKLNF